MIAIGLKRRLRFISKWSLAHVVIPDKPLICAGYVTLIGAGWGSGNLPIWCFTIASQTDALLR